MYNIIDLDLGNIFFLDKKEINKIENYVNDMVNTAADVKTRIMTPKEAVEKGALAMFGEKYGEEVRVLSMGSENGGYFSTELCGGTHVKNTKDKKTGEWMKGLEPEDLLKFGLIPEFIGRLPMIATLEDLDEKSLIKILQEPKNSLTKQYQELFKLDGAKLTFKENALKEIAQKAISKKTGARGLRSILENILLKTMYDLPSQDNIEEVIVDAGAAKGQSQPILVHAKGDNKSKSNKTTAA